MGMKTPVVHLLSINTINQKLFGTRACEMETSLIVQLRGSLQSILFLNLIKLLSTFGNIIITMSV